MIFGRFLKWYNRWKERQREDSHSPVHSPDARKGGWEWVQGASSWMHSSGSAAAGNWSQEPDTEPSTAMRTWGPCHWSTPVPREAFFIKLRKSPLISSLWKTVTFSCFFCFFFLSPSNHICYLILWDFVSFCKKCVSFCSSDWIISVNFTSNSCIHSSVLLSKICD